MQQRHGISRDVFLPPDKWRKREAQNENTFFFFLKKGGEERGFTARGER